MNVGDLETILSVVVGVVVLSTPLVMISIYGQEKNYTNILTNIFRNGTGALIYSTIQLRT